MFVTIYVNKLLSELLAPKDTTFNVTDYTDNPTLFDTAHSMKQTLEKHLLINIAAIRDGRKECNEVSLDGKRKADK